MRSNEYNKALDILIISYLFYTIFISISLNKGLETLITFLIILVPITFKNIIINMYESKAERKIISQENIEKEKKKLMHYGDFFYTGLIISIIVGLTMGEGEYIIGVPFAVFSFFVLSYSIWDDIKNGMLIISPIVKLS